MKIVTVIQARSGSTRLPNKVLMSVAGKPLLLHMVERVRRARMVGHVVVATTTQTTDDHLAELCRRGRIDLYRGHPTDLLDRHYMTGRLNKADVIVKIPSDCPLIDPSVIDRVISFYLNHSTEYDFVSNLHPPSYPDGQDVEVIPVKVLKEAWKEARKSFEREHTTPFIWDRPDRYRIGNVAWEAGVDYSMTHRWTIDYKEDFDFVRAVYEELFPRKPDFSLSDVLLLLDRRPELAAINARHAGVNWYRHHLNELNTVRADQTRPTNA